MVDLRANKEPDTVLQGKMRRAKRVLFWEALWDAAFPAVCIGGIFLLLTFLGVFELLPRLVHFAVLGLFLVAFGYALRPVFQIHKASDEAALRRIEKASGVPHRPASAYRDDIAGEPEDPASLTLWQAHKARLAKLIAGLKAGWPRSKLAARDPYALRYGLLMAVGAIGILTWSDVPDRIKASLVPAERASAPVFMDAWVAPPGYTGKAPVFLARGQFDRNKPLPENAPVVEVPVNSTLLMRLNGVEAPLLKFEASGHGKPAENGEIEFTAKDLAKLSDDSTPQVFELKTALSRPQQITLFDGEDVIAQWAFGLIDDNPPQIKVSDIGAARESTLNFKYETSDDYGVTGVDATITLSKDAMESEAARGLASEHFPAPEFTVDLPRVDPRNAKGEVFRDLTAHPWAGLAVEMTLTARDAAGQASTHENAPARFILPERQFNEPLARAVIEQRRNLVRNLQNSTKVSDVIDAFLIYPDGLIRRSGVYLGLRAAHKAMMNAKSDKDLVPVVDLLWEIALAIEDGNLSVAERELRKIRQQLAKALAENAPPEEIARLMDKMRKAMERFMREMAREMQRRMEEGQLSQQQQPLNPDQTITSKDLQKMMDQIEKLAKQGSRDAAQKLLSELERLMENMRPGMMTKRGQMRNSPSAKSLQQLGELMRKQQELMDETMRMPQGSQQQGQGQQGQRGQRGQQSGEGSETARELARRQGELGEMLKEMMDALRNRGVNPPQSLGDAHGEMQGAEGSLGRNDSGSALGQQGRAMENLRQGAQHMANEMMRQGTGAQGAMGRHEETGPEGEDVDPLGRPGPSANNETYGKRKNMVPTERAIERAQEILRDLRDRYSKPDRPRLELDYLQRLLREIY
ncbi:MAG: TIGR02302 family protein [Hyphomicrobiales bacterium]